MLMDVARDNSINQVRVMFSCCTYYESQFLLILGTLDDILKVNVRTK